MPNIAVVGVQWGDEGKGKIVDFMAPAFQIVARYNGGHNAGHTVIRGTDKIVLHLIPAGILHEGVLCVLGNGMVIDPAALEAEMADVARLGIDVLENIVISDRAHLLLPHHRALDLMCEQRKGAAKIGTTGRGIGPCYEEKAARRGVRVCDVVIPERARIAARLAPAKEYFEAVCRGFGVPAEVDFEKVADDLLAFGAKVAPRVRDVSILLQRELNQGYAVLYEGAQASHLDIDHGTYPFVTSSSAGVGGISSGLGVPPSRIDGVLGIVKAYTTRVGAGPFPTELTDAVGEGLRARGGEYGATTGRPRRCGWFDAPLVRSSIRVNGVEGLAVTKLDVLDELDEIPVCVAYRYKNTRLEETPADPDVLSACAPVYEKVPGWKQETGSAREWKDLPSKARDYLSKLADLASVEIAMVSTGPDRDQSVLNEKSRTSGWLARAM